jgi:hypothetical protein
MTPICEEEIVAAQTLAGAWTRKQLEKWGVYGWPPPKGWKKRLIKYGTPDRADEQITKSKHRPGWDHAFYIERSQGQERERAPRIEPTDIDLPTTSDEIDMERCLKAWAAIGVTNDPAWIRESWASIMTWQKKHPGKNRRCA